MEVLRSESETALENLFAMKGGNEDSSYANNSSAQLKGIEAMKPILERSIYDNMRFKFNGAGIFRIADFGCGTGRNTLVVANTIVRALQCSLEEGEMPEFEVYFVDLPSNDFNLLFRMLPPLRQGCTEDDGDHNPVAARSYFAAAVSGSHFRRLLPKKSLHFCHSSASLHWMSRVPESVQERSSPRVYVSSDCEEAVGAAYLQQFKKDFTEFLISRAEEMVDGGCVFITLPGRKAGTQIIEEQGALGYIARDLEHAFEELVNEGIIEKEKWESFNMPWFGPSLEEVESVVKKEGSFAIQNLEILGGFPLYPMTHLERGKEIMIGRFVANMYRAGFENILKSHLGYERLIDEFFTRIAKRASLLFEEYLSREMKLVLVLLIKKNTHNDIN